MELVPKLVRRAHRLTEEQLANCIADAADSVANRLAECTLLGEPIDFDDEDRVLVAAYYLGCYDLLDLALDELKAE